jgi:hypothetical protein
MDEFDFNNIPATTINDYENYMKQMYFAMFSLYFEPKPLTNKDVAEEINVKFEKWLDKFY